MSNPGPKDSNIVGIMGICFFLFGLIIGLATRFSLSSVIFDIYGGIFITTGLILLIIALFLSAGEK